MANETAKITAENPDHEPSKEDIGSELEEKTEDESSPERAQSDIELAEKQTSTEQRDLEKVETETQDPVPVKVPRSQRRGLFGRFAILAEVEEPKNYSRQAKWYITFVVAMAAIAAPMGSAIIFRMTLHENTTALADNSQLPSFKFQMIYIPLQQSLTSQPPYTC